MRQWILLIYIYVIIRYSNIEKNILRNKASLSLKLKSGNPAKEIRQKSLTRWKSRFL